MYISLPVSFIAGEEFATYAPVAGINFVDFYDFFSCTFLYTYLFICICVSVSLLPLCTQCYLSVGSIVSDGLERFFQGVHYLGCILSAVDDFIS